MKYIHIRYEAKNVKNIKYERFRQNVKKLTKNLELFLFFFSSNYQRQLNFHRRMGANVIYLVKLHDFWEKVLFAYYLKTQRLCRKSGRNSEFLSRKEIMCKTTRKA